ncbi:MAG: DNA-binding protein [Thermodesulfovibrionales bacterium]|nr:DNA-binding protein [Thermodesulfovibrionales bacterium]
MEYLRLSKIHQGRLNKGDELISTLIVLLKEKNIQLGSIYGLGAVSSAKLGYFNASTKKYEERFFDENMEIISLGGNISLKDGDIFPHIHVVFSRKDFSVVGGHLLSPTVVYAFEFVIHEYSGKPFVRQFDGDTGLYLWK